jgi:hypothetical protein
VHLELIVFDFLFQELHAMNVVPRLKLTEV